MLIPYESILSSMCPSEKALEVRASGERSESFALGKRFAVAKLTTSLSPIWCVEVRHGRATTGTGLANVLDSCGLEGMVWHGRATAGTGRAKVLAVLAQNFFSLFS